MSKRETSNTRILIVDEFPVFLEGLRAIISSAANLEVIGEAGNGNEAVLKAVQLQPDLILMDLTMPLLNGTEATRIIKQRYPAIKIIALTAHKSRDFVQATFEAGANGYVLKDDSSANLLAAINSVLCGQVYISPGVCDTVLGGFLGHSENAKSAVSWCRLTVREREVMKLVAEGHKNREIASHLSLSIKTVEKHRSNLMSKLNLRNVTELTSYAIGHSLVAV
ncbi:MAG: response regulator transcription factor [Gammaproteobacteria bacterium]|jgi:DNA-binding NarL/FixJ family response regulator